MLVFGYIYLGIVGLLSALVIVAALNPVHRIALLVLLFLVGSFIYIILDYYFLGITYFIMVGSIILAHCTAAIQWVVCLGYGISAHRGFHH